MPPNTHARTRSLRTEVARRPRRVDVHILISVNRADIENPRATHKHTCAHAVGTSKATKSVVAGFVRVKQTPANFRKF